MCWEGFWCQPLQEREDTVSRPPSCFHCALKAPEEALDSVCSILPWVRGGRECKLTGVKSPLLGWERGLLTNEPQGPLGHSKCFVFIYNLTLCVLRPSNPGWSGFMELALCTSSPQGLLLGFIGLQFPSHEGDSFSCWRLHANLGS